MPNPQSLSPLPLPIDSSCLFKMENSPAKMDRSQRKRYERSQMLVRILASLPTLAAALAMFFNRQSSDLFGFRLDASYKSSPAFEFFVIGNALACGYSLLSAPFVSNLVNGYIMGILDLVIMGLVMASVSAATTIAYIGKKGNAEIGWTEVCSYYEKFCRRAAISLAFSYVGFLLFLLICALSFVQRTKHNLSA